LVVLGAGLVALRVAWVRPTCFAADAALLALFHHLFWHGFITNHSPAMGVGARASAEELATLVRTEVALTWLFAVAALCVLRFGVMSS
jgi:hypothetical protein